MHLINWHASFIQFTVIGDIGGMMLDFGFMIKIYVFWLFWMFTATSIRQNRAKTAARFCLFLF